jgi:hypothetical protein
MPFAHGHVFLYILRSIRRSSVAALYLTSVGGVLGSQEERNLIRLRGRAKIVQANIVKPPTAFFLL